MGKNYHQFNLIEREKIAILRAEGRSIRAIGRILGRTHSSISRELKRNHHFKTYLPQTAHEKAGEKKKKAGKRRRLKNIAIRQFVQRKLEEGWSPEQIAKRLSLHYVNASISHEAIYQWIYKEAPELIGCLPRRHKRRRLKGNKRKNKRSLIPNRINICQRPEGANLRTEEGHWEADLIVSRESKAALQVLCERKSRYTRIRYLEQKTARLTREAICQTLRQYPRNILKTITYDNGSENTCHEWVNRELKIQSYFCNPYHSWEKGTIENTNGLIRRFIPKKTDLSKVEKKDIKLIELRLNNRPRKCLDFFTPAEIFRKICSGALPP